jgi:hypothetical protein
MIGEAASDNDTQFEIKFAKFFLYKTQRKDKFAYAGTPPQCYGTAVLVRLSTTLV